MEDSPVDDGDPECHGEEGGLEGPGEGVDQRQGARGDRVVSKPSA